MTRELAKTYTPADVEPTVNQRWLDANAFHAEPSDPGSPYAIVIPPPNVTAALHMGHALNNTLQDILIRWRRMAGDNAMWMPGTDHAGIATQTVVEKRVLQEEGKRRTEFTRDAFVQKIQAWKDEYEARITDQLKRMGCSCDWDRQRFTMDPICAKAVREAFFKLFKDGLIYRGKRLVNWDPVTQTALADDEVEMQEIDGHFYYMKYPVVELITPTPGEPASAGVSGVSVVSGDSYRETGEYLTVATTRPETMLGDTAVAMNPRDPRAAALRGKYVKLPIVGRVIPIVEDDYVVLPDPDSSDEKAKFSTGFLKVTPAHDPNDYEIGQRFSLPMINVMAPDASISIEHGWPTEENPQDNEDLKPLVGLAREAARKAIVQWFKDHDLLEEVKPYRHSVGHSYRSHVAIEPYLSDQWYVKVTDDKLRGAALRAIGATSRDRKGAEQPYFITFTTYGNWLHGDARGSIDRENNQLGQPTIIGDEKRERQAFDQMKQPALSLNDAQRQAVQHAIVEVCQHRGWQLWALHVRPQHVHVVVSADETPEKVMNDFKAYATRRLREQGHVDEDRRVWTRHGSTRWLDDEASVTAAAVYVVEQQGETLQPAPVDRRPGGQVAHEAGGSAPLPHGRGSSDWEGRLRFTPERYTRTFQQWHENIRDWCISRQLWWGHRIPVWSMKPELPGLDAEFPNFGADSDAYTEELQRRLDVLAAAAGLPNNTFQARGEWNGSEYVCFICTRSAEADDVFAAIRTWIPPLNDQPHVQVKALGSSEADQAGHSFLEMIVLDSDSFNQDPDVLDTWFSSALWPISTLGWPDENPALEKWNPSNTLCTAREIITLWVSRMVMFNLYFRDCLPFTDVFIHAMIQDGHGQKMSKSLGNGVDPLDTIHLHGSDAMRFTLTSMTTQTQDVRMPVDLVCPHTGETFTPKFVTTPAGHKVAAPIQTCPSDPSKKMVSSFGLASGQAVPTKDMPLARNTSEKFDLGRNFANKLWNATRFALSHLSETQPAKPADASPRASAGSVGVSGSDVGTEVPTPLRNLADRWILSRLAATVRDTDAALGRFEFKPYADGLYDFIWRDLCDWYIEAIKPTVKQDAQQRRVLASVLDATLRLLHPVMPFITEELWTALNDVAPDRSAAGLALPPSELLCRAAWPKADDALIDAQAERAFDLVRELSGSLRAVRSQYKVPPRQQVECSVAAPAEMVETILASRQLIETMANVKLADVSPATQKPDDAAVAVVGDIQLFLHNLIDAESEKQRLGKRLEQLSKTVQQLRGRLQNKSYVDKAPAHLVDETRAQLTTAEKELESLEQQLKAL